MYAKFFKLSLVALTLISITAYAGRLQIGEAQVDGDTVTVPVMLSDESSGPVSTMDFELRYDPNVFEPVHAANGAAAAAADKNVSGNANGAGEYKVIVVGLNQNAIPAGEVASVVLRRMPDATDAQSNVRIVNTTFADVNANEIPSRGDSRSISLDPNANTEDNADAEDNGNTEDNAETDDTQSDDGDMTSNDQQERASREESSDSGQSNQERQNQPAGGSSGNNDNIVVTDSGQNGGPTSNRSATPGGGALSGPSSEDDADTERMEDAVAAADNTRRTIATPATGDNSDADGATENGGGIDTQASVSGGDESAENQAISSDSTTPDRTQMAKADTNATQSASMTDAAETGADDETPPQKADANTQPQDATAAAAEGAGDNTATIAIVIALVAAGVLGLFFLRNRLFA